MWTLLIISFIQDHNDYKVPRFKDYVNEQQFTLQHAVTGAHFPEDQTANR